jgi:hypothetical protein
VSSKWTAVAEFLRGLLSRTPSVQEPSYEKVAQLGDAQQGSALDLYWRISLTSTIRDVVLGMATRWLLAVLLSQAVLGDLFGL